MSRHEEPVATVRVDEFSEAGAPPLPWADVSDQLARAEMFWLSTVRRDGRPHVAPLPAVWTRGNLHFVTGAHEQKARNLDANPPCILTTGTNSFHDGTDIVVEGEATRVTDKSLLDELAGHWRTQYDWDFGVTPDGFVDRSSDDHPVAVYQLHPRKVLAFTKDPYSQTRYTFA